MYKIRRFGSRRFCRLQVTGYCYIAVLFGGFFILAWQLRLNLNWPCYVADSWLTLFHFTL